MPCQGSDLPEDRESSGSLRFPSNASPHGSPQDASIFADSWSRAMGDFSTGRLWSPLPRLPHWSGSGTYSDPFMPNSPSPMRPSPMYGRTPHPSPERDLNLVPDQYAGAGFN